MVREGSADSSLDRPAQGIDPALSRRLLAELPDLPGWVEARGMLLGRTCRAIGWEPGAAGGLLVDEPMRLVAVVGQPSGPALSSRPAAAGEGWSFLVQVEDDEAIQPRMTGWQRLEAIEHELRQGELPLPLADAPRCRLLGPEDGDRLSSWPPRTRREILTVLARAPVAAAFAPGGEIAAVCCACYQTGRIWDVSIDTLAVHRRHGYAAAAVRFLTSVQADHGLVPVWGAHVENRASLRLAAKLGFEAVGRLITYDR